MSKSSFRSWKVLCESLPGSPEIGEIFFPLMPPAAGPASGSSDDGFGDPAAMASAMEAKRGRAARISAAVAGSAAMAAMQVPLFRYSPEWIESGYAIGSDLPLESGVHKPGIGKRTFGFLADRALDASSAVWHGEALARGANGAQIAPDAGSLESASVFLPHRDAHAGAVRFVSESGEAAGAVYPVAQESRGIEPLLYALHAAERGRGDLKTFIELAASCALPGRHSPHILIAGREECVMTLRHITDLVDMPLWREAYLRLGRAAGIPSARSRLVDTMGHRALLTSRVDRAEGRPLMTLSARTLLEGRTPSYLGIADILNREGAAPGEDLPDVWMRMAFALLTGAADGPEKWLFTRDEWGWRLAPVHGWMPGAGITRPMSADGRRPLSSAEDLVRLAPYFGLQLHDAKRRLMAIRRATSGWEACAVELGAQPEEVEELRPGFETY